MFAHFTQHGIPSNRIQPCREGSFHLTKGLKASVSFIECLRTQIFGNHLQMCTLKHMVNKTEDFAFVTRHQVSIKLDITIFNFSNKLGIGHNKRPSSRFQGATQRIYLITMLGAKSCDLCGNIMILYYNSYPWIYVIVNSNTYNSVSSEETPAFSTKASLYVHIFINLLNCVLPLYAYIFRKMPVHAKKIHLS